MRATRPRLFTVRTTFTAAKDVIEGVEPGVDFGQEKHPIDVVVAGVGETREGLGADAVHEVVDRLEDAAPRAEAEELHQLLVRAAVVAHEGGRISSLDRDRVVTK